MARGLDWSGIYGYLGTGGMMLKRTADWLEKMSVAAMAVSIFQGNNYGVVLGVACFFGSLYITRKIGGNRP